MLRFTCLFAVAVVAGIGASIIPMMCGAPNWVGELAVVGVVYALGVSDGLQAACRDFSRAMAK